ncbi:serine protease FAM111A-like [Mantella aurantiaca]
MEIPVSESNDMENLPQKKSNIQSSTKSQVITFIYKDEAINRNVEEDKPVINYAMKSVDSENIILYSYNLEAIINPYIPCRALGKGEKIEIIRKKQSKNKEAIMSMLPCSNFDVSGEGAFFKVNSKGCTKGDGTRTILHNGDIYKWNKKPFAVYGRKDQTIEEAIQNDKRFNIINEYSLKHSITAALEERFVHLSFLDTKMVYIVQVTNDKSNSKPDPNTPKTEGLQRSDKKAKDFQNADEMKPDPQTSLFYNPESKLQTSKIPEIYCTPTSTKFSNAFNDLCKKFSCMKLRTDIIKDHIRYKQPMEADTFKLLTLHLESVALIRYTANNCVRTGTFFLLTDSLGLTCFHVLEPLLGSNPDWKTKPFLNISIIFNYDSELSEKVECSAILEYCHKECDLAFLRISQPQKKGLLQYVASPPQNGTVAIIGHPSGSSKKIDLICTVINFSKRAEQILNNILSDSSYIHVLTEHNFTLMAHPELVTYDTCLYHGASGSPVFNEKGELVAMHLAGYLARTDLEKKSIIEYGRNIIDILIFGAIHLEELRLWFRKLNQHDSSLTVYIKQYTDQNGHSVNMQTVIRDFLKCLEKNESLQEQNPDLDDSGIAGSPMDISY